MFGARFAPLCAILLLAQAGPTLAQPAPDPAANVAAKNKTNTFTSYQIIGLRRSVVNPRINVGLQIVTPAEGENNAVDAFAYNGWAQYVAERYDFADGHFQAVGGGEIVGGYFGAAFYGPSDPVDAGVDFTTTEAQTATHNGMDLKLLYTPNGSTALTTGLAVSLHGKGGVTIGDERLFGPIADLGNGALHAADSIATGNHLRFTGSAPAASSCGPSPKISGADAAGVVTTGGKVASCALTFAKAYASPPVCMVQTFGAPSPTAYLSAVSPTGLTASFSSPLNGAFSYICVGRS